MLIELTRYLRHRYPSESSFRGARPGDTPDVSWVVGELSMVMDEELAFVTYRDPAVGIHPGCPRR